MCFYDMTCCLTLWHLQDISTQEYKGPQEESYLQLAVGMGDDMPPQEMGFLCGYQE